MKKRYTSLKYKRYNKLKSEKGKIRRRNKFSQKADYFLSNVTRAIVKAPRDFRFIDNPEKCLKFFSKMRSKFSISSQDNIRYIRATLKDVEKIDYATISVLSAISDELDSKKILFRGDFPDNQEAKQYLVNSGFLERMFENNGNRFTINSRSKFIRFEKGSGTLTVNDNKNISNLIKEVSHHLLEEKKKCQPLKTLILEICGNSIEWAQTEKQDWLFGVKFLNKKVIFTVTDVGKGIINTLHFKFGDIIKNKLNLNSNLKVLEGAFMRKYGSSSGEENRNKGLPSIRVNYEEGKIKDLKVITNDVLLYYGNTESRTLSSGIPGFGGTFYQWEIDSDSLSKF